jgi:hypothetical protein
MSPEELHEKKKLELINALTRDEVQGPLFAGLTLAKFVGGLLISAGVSIATSVISGLVVGRRTQQGEQGRLSGEILFQRSAQGDMIGEVYGADPGDGLGGGSKVGAIVIFASGIRKHQTTQRSGGGKKQPKTETINFSYDMDVAYMWANHGPYDIKKLWFNNELVFASIGRTGIVDPDIPVDTPYIPDFPPDPTGPYTRPVDRISGALAVDLVTGEKTGVAALGGFHDFAFYPGNAEQLPDPTVEAVIDARYGEGSTPAYRLRAYTTHTRLDLSRWSGLPPNPTAILEHETLKQWGPICASWCEREALTSDDYDFSGVDELDVRGLRLVQQYQPNEVMDSLAPLFDSYFYEDDKIRAGLLSEESVVTIPEDELGWYESESTGDTFDDVSSEVSPRWEVPRRVVVRYVSPERDYDPGAEGEARQVTGHRREATLDVDVTLTPAEARAAAAKELYRRHVEVTRHRFTLSWTYLYLRPGNVVTVIKGAFTFKIRLTQISRGVSAIECEGVDAEPAVFDQAAVISAESPFELAPVLVPPMTVAGFLDMPAYQTEHAGLAGVYVYAVKRTGEGAFHGATWLRHTRPDDAVNGWDILATLQTEATTGRARTALGDWSNVGTEDGTRAFTADAATDALTATNHQLENDETVTVSNSGGALPGGLSSLTLYYVANRTANTLKLSLTPGGSATNITSAGTGTHSIQRALELDLYGDQTLQSVSADAIANGANLSALGGEYLQFRTAVQVSTSPNRWRVSNFSRGLHGTEPVTGAHAAEERFVLLDAAVKWVELDISELNQARDYKMLTVGQSFDDAALLEDVVWMGGTLKYPPPGIQATLDASTGDWRFLLFGEETRDPEGERYSLAVVGGRSFTLRGAASRPVSLSTASAYSDSPPPPGKGGFRSADMPGNSVTDDLAYAIQQIKGERAAVSATWETTLDESDTPVGPDSVLTFAAGAFVGLTMTIHAQTSAQASSLVIFDNVLGTVFTDADGEATGTRYTVEFKDGKAHFFRNRGRGSEPFYIHSFPNYEIEFPGEEGLPFPLEARFSAGTDSTWAEIEIDDEGAAVLYTAAEQESDGFTVPLTSITIRASQQRVVGGVVVDGQISEITFP